VEAMSGAVRIGFCTIASKSIPITISETGPGYRRLTSAIQQSLKDAAAELVSSRIEAGKVFKLDTLQSVTEIRIKCDASQNSLVCQSQHDLETWLTQARETQAFTIP
jgi:hypothetical protein